MGILSSIESGLSAVRGGISNACSYIERAISSVGSGICKLASSIVAPFPEISLAVNVVKVIVVVVSALAEILGITTKEDKADELGYKAVQCEKKLEEFSSTQKYIEHLRNEVKLDMGKFDNLSPEEKLAYTALGVSIMTKAIEEKVKVTIPAEFLHEVAKQKLKGEEMVVYIESFKRNGLTNLKDMSDYLKGNLDGPKCETVDSAMTQALKNLNPDLAEGDIQGKVVEMKRESRKDEGM